jgi:hypothetical protein
MNKRTEQCDLKVEGVLHFSQSLRQSQQNRKGEGIVYYTYAFGGMLNEV